MPDFTPTIFARHYIGYVQAGAYHALHTLTDIVWFCIHAVDQATEAYQKQDPHSTDGMLFIGGSS